AERNLRDRVTDPTARPRADHQQDARLRALVHEDVACPGRAVDEIPLLHMPLLLLDDRRARAAQDEEVLLRLLGVVERRAVARLDHGEVDADLLELAALGLEKAPLPEPRALDPARLRLARVDDEPGIGHAAMLVRPGAARIARDTIAACPLKLKQRLGSLDAATIAGTDPAELETMFRTPPAIHRFPGSMAKRVHD